MPRARPRPSFLVAAALAAASLFGAPRVGSITTADAATSCPRPFPSTNVWNRRIDTLPVRSDSKTLLTTMGLTRTLHPDFGTFAGYGIPFNLVTSSTPRSTVSFLYAAESDKVAYPIPSNPKIEGAGAAGDRHLIMVDPAACHLWELFAADHSTGTWHAGSGATWDLVSNALRPDGWTSADAAGLPIYPGLVRYNEVAAGAIAHAIRFTVPKTRSAHLYPARHDAGSGTSPSLPPMGLRLRLKAGVDIASFPVQSRVILAALKQYGMILADNGSAYYISGTSDARWSDDDLHALGRITGSMFEVVDTCGLRNGTTSPRLDAVAPGC
ncbi:MAG TPA: hypothetical protein VIK65_08810 [Candidatus Limnocylindrales bacterium]